MEWWMWLPVAVVDIALGSLLLKHGTTRGERGWAWSLLLLGWLLLTFPLLQRGALSLVAWMHASAPEALARWLMPSRAILGLGHYQARASLILESLLQGLGLLALLLLGTVVLGTPSLRAWIQTGWQRPLVRGAMVMGVFPLLIAALGWAWLTLQFRMGHPVFYDECRKIWGHRGHPEPPDIPENSIASFQRAFDLGAPGVEMDVAYEPSRRRFVIRRPDREYAQELTLDEVFAAVGNRGYFWLDIKTLRALPPQQAQQAAEDLRTLVETYQLQDRVIVESEHPENLTFFVQQGLHTSYWIFNIDEEAFPQSSWELARTLWRIRWNYARGGFSAISMDHRFYTPQVAQALKGARIHLFTVNDEDTLRALVARPEVRVILTDTDMYDLGDCP